MVNTYPDRGVTFTHGDGMYLIDANGERYLDLMINYGVNIFGHTHPKIVAALVKQLNNITNLHGSFTSDIRADASQLLIKRCGLGYAQVYWANSGSEAIEAALKFATLQSGKKKFVRIKGGYHGKTLGALSATSGDKYRKSFEPLMWNFVQVVFDDVGALKNVLNEQIAAVVIEPIQGESGVVVPSDDYIKRVRTLCKQNGVLLILDEIQTGVGRTGTFLASQHDGVIADIVCLGKGLAGGMPVGAVVVNSDVAKSIIRGIHTSTFGANPLTCSGVLATLKLLDEKTLFRVRKLGSYFIHKLQSIKSGKIIEVRGKGLMIGIEVGEWRNNILKALQKEKILAIPAGEGVVRFLPPYIIEKNHVDKVVSVLKSIL